jgi:hypothetical protein
MRTKLFFSVVFATIFALVLLFSRGIFSPVSAQSVVFAPTIDQASTPGYAGLASGYLTSMPPGSTLAIGTARGTVQVKNFYGPNLGIDDGGDLIVKATADYLIVYDYFDSSFWLAITGKPFTTWQNVAEQDFIQTLGITEADACKLDVTSGVIYSQGDPNDGQSFPLSFCVSGAFNQ